MRLAPTPEGPWPHRGPLGVTPFPLSIVRPLRATLSTGFRDSAHWSELWLPASYPVPFWLQRVSLWRWATITMAQPRLRLRCPEVPAKRAVRVRLPALAVYPRCNPLRTRRGVGGHAVTSAPEGRGLHPHGDGVTRPCGLMACLEVLPSFQPTGRRSDLVVDRGASEMKSSSSLDFLFLCSVWTTFCCLMSDKITSAISTA